MEKCYMCERDEGKVKLVDSIYGSEIVKICEECALRENTPIIRKPTSNQLEESEKPYSVRQRMRRMAGIKEEKKQDISRITHEIFQRAVKKDEKEQFKGKAELAKKRNQPLNLIENYNWAVMMERKKRKIDKKQLAEAIGESETAVRMIESKELPDDAFRIISKMEQYLGIKLRKEENKMQALMAPATILKMDKEAVKNLTLDDLRKMKQEKERIETESREEEKQEDNINRLIDEKSGKRGVFSRIKDWFNKEVGEDKQNLDARQGDAETIKES